MSTTESAAGSCRWMARYLDFSPWKSKLYNVFDDGWLMRYMARGNHDLAISLGGDEGWCSFNQ